jgi:hypothetical protein
MNPTIKGEFHFPSKHGFYLNASIIARFEAVRKHPLWFLMAFDPACVERIFGKGDEAIQALGVFEGMA